MKTTVERVIKECMANCYQDTAMALDIICENLCYKHGLNATFYGRSIYIDDERVASIKTCIEPCEDCKIIAIYDYKIIGG